VNKGFMFALVAFPAMPTVWVYSLLAAWSLLSGFSPSCRLLDRTAFRVAEIRGDEPKLPW